jgi:ankyrin repeat protein
VSVKDDHGFTALTLASKNGHQGAVQLLKSAGATDR